MNQRRTDLDRARELGISIDHFRSLVGYDVSEAGYVGPKDKKKNPKTGEEAVEIKKKEFKDAEAACDPKDKKKKKEKLKSAKDVDDLSNVARRKQLEAMTYSLHDEATDVEGIGDGTMIPFETDEDVKNKTSNEIEHYWDRPVETPADKALYYGYHIHSKDNMYGLHAHYPGGPLGGGHLHNSQNPQGYHTHRYTVEELTQFKFSRPGVMIELDGPHVHQQNAPDGKHVHSEENFGPASDSRAKDVADRNSKTDTVD